MVHRIANIATAGAASNSYYYASGRLSHLVFGSSVPFGATDFLTVTLNSPHHEPIVLVNRISMVLLQAISDFEAGASSVLQIQLNVVGANDYVGFFVAVDLGNLDLQNTNSKLEILIEAGQALTQGSMAAVDARPTAHDFYHKYSNSSLLVNSAPDVDRVYVTYITGSLVPFTDANLNDLAVEIHSMHGDRFATFQDVLAFTAVFGEIEAQGPNYVYCAFRDDDDVVGPVSWMLSGTDADSDIGIISRSRALDPIRVAKSVAASMARTQAKLDQKTPDVQNAHVIAGLTPPRGTLDAAHLAVKQHATKLTAKKGTAGF